MPNRIFARLLDRARHITADRVRHENGCICKGIAADGLSLRHVFIDKDGQALHIRVLRVLAVGDPLVGAEGYGKAAAGDSFRDKR